jgi:hypothetical protein
VCGVRRDLPERESSDSSEKMRLSVLGLINGGPAPADSIGIMLHPSVERELFGKRRGLNPRREREARQIHLPKRHVAIALLMMLVLASWALDSLHVLWVPRPVHETVASFIDSQRDRVSTFRWLPDVDSTVGYSPIDGCPITFGSVLLLGALCVAGLAALGFSSPNKGAR